MATRLYLPSTGTAPISPALSTWTQTTGNDYRSAVRTRISSAMTNKVTAQTATAANSSSLSRTYISEPLAAQTIATGTFGGVLRALESAANDNVDAVRCVIRVVNSAGTTFRTPTVYGPANGTVNEFATTLTSRNISPSTLGSTAAVTVLDGDRLVIEIGFTNTTSGASISATLNYGDNSATDLSFPFQGETAANNPWIEFSQTITFLSQGTASITEGDDSVSSGGSVVGIVTGDASITEAGDTLISNATTPVNADASITEGNDSVSSGGSVTSTITGDASITEAGDTVSAAGTAVLGAVVGNPDGVYTPRSVASNSFTNVNSGSVVFIGSGPYTGISSAGTFTNTDPTGYNLETGSVVTVTPFSFSYQVLQTNVFSSPGGSGHPAWSMDILSYEAGPTNKIRGVLRVTGFSPVGCYCFVSLNFPSAGQMTLSWSSPQTPQQLVERNDTVSSDGTLVPITFGDASITEADDTVSADASSIIVGSASITEAGDTLSTAATVPVIANLAIIEQSDTASSATAVLISGTASITEASDTVSAAGVVLPVIFGAALMTEQGDTLIASSGLVAIAELDYHELDDTMMSAGVVLTHANASITEASDTLTAAASLPLIADSSITEASDTITAFASNPILASASITEQDDSLTSSASNPVVASALITEDDDTLEASASNLVIANSSITEEGDTVQANAGPVNFANLNVTEDDDGVSSEALVFVLAVAVITEDDDTVTSSGTLSVTASAAITEQDDTLQADATVLSTSSSSFFVFF